MLTYLSNAPIKKLPGQLIERDSLMENNFLGKIDKESFPVQYDYRMFSINEIFMKELIMTVFICAVMIIINVTFV